MSHPRVHFLVPHDRPQTTLANASTLLQGGASGVFLTPQVSGRARDLVSLAVTLQSQFPEQVVGVRRLGQASVSEAEEGFRRGVSAMWVPRGTPPSEEAEQRDLGEKADMKRNRLWANLAFTSGHTGRARVRAQAMARAGWIPVLNSLHPDAFLCAAALKNLPIFKGERRASMAWLIRLENTWPIVPAAVTDVLVAPPSAGWNRLLLVRALSTALGERRGDQ